MITAEGEYLAKVSGKFRYQAAHPSDFPAVGDFVMAGKTGKELRQCVRIIKTTALETTGIEEILPYLSAGTTAAFLGSSGVGKSTLVNRLLGEERLATGGIRNDDKGRHTTTHRELLFLPDGGMVIDTPGMRELGMWDAKSGIDRTFSDIEELALQCRFLDCTHTVEPGCAVQKALKNGTLSKERM